MERERNGRGNPGIDRKAEMFMPKNTRKSCIRSGVPWKTRMKPVAKRRSARVSETRINATSSPPTLPPAKAIAERAIVHCAAATMTRNSFQPKALIMTVLLTAEGIFEGRFLERVKQRGETDRQGKIDQSDCDIDLEARKGGGLEVVAGSSQVIR